MSFLWYHPLLLVEFPFDVPSNVLGFHYKGQNESEVEDIKRNIGEGSKIDLTIRDPPLM
jgi:hypothetical protein